MREKLKEDEKILTEWSSVLSAWNKCAITHDHVKCIRDVVGAVQPSQPPPNMFDMLLDCEYCNDETLSDLKTTF